MTEHPMRSDRDNLIKNLQRESEELKATIAQKNRIVSELEEKLRVKRGASVKRFFKVLLLCIIIPAGLSGVVAGIRKAWLNEVRLDDSCSRLCRMALGDYAISGNETKGNGCDDDERHCICTTRGNDVTLAKTSYDDLMGDLKKIAKKLNVEAWEKCMQLQSNSAQKVSCDHIPWKTDFDHGRQEQN